MHLCLEFTKSLGRAEQQKQKQLRVSRARKRGAISILCYINKAFSYYLLYIL
jgi:hypothetical protein